MGLFIGKQSDDESVHVELANDFVTQTAGILAQRRKGKTYTASVIAEEMVREKIPFVVLDPTSAWWGLRASADGKSEGLPVTILGGDHGDVPIERGDGAAIAELVIEEPGYYVIDFGRFESGNAEKIFATDFATQLYRRKGQPGADFPLHLFIDEADRFVPQQIRDKRDTDERLLGAIENIVKRGGIRGLGTTLISQRAAVVNKNVLEQLDVLIVLRVGGPNDRKAIKGYVEASGTAEQVSELMGSLASLDIGECWLWEPGEDTFAKVKIRARTTFNSSATPKPGERRVEPKRLAQVDLEAVKTRLVETIEKAKADDPVELRKRIRTLENDVVALRKAEDAQLQDLDRMEREAAAKPSKPEVIEVPIVTPKVVADFVAACERWEKNYGTTATRFEKAMANLVEAGRRADAAFMESMKQFQATISTQGSAVSDLQERIRLLGAGGPSHGSPPVGGTASHGGDGNAATYPRGVTVVSIPKRTEERPDPARVRGASSSSVPGTEEGVTPLKKGARRMLQALASVHPAKLTRQQLGFFADISSTSGTFSDYLSLLRTRGFLDETDVALVTTTAAGLEYLGADVPERLTTEQIVTTAASKLKAGAKRMFLVLVAAYPDPVSREYLAQQSEISVSSGTFSDYLSILRSKGLMVDIDRQNVQANHALFRIGAP